MPAEWEPHRATWISWPHHEPDWPGKLGADPVGLRRDRARARRARAGRDPLPRRGRARDARRALDAHAVAADRVRLHVVPTDRVWLRDSAPTGVLDAGGACRARQLGVQRLGEVRQLRSSTRRSAPRSRAITGSPRVEPRARRSASRARARRRRHRGQRRGPAARHRGVAAQRRPGAQPRARRASDYERLFAEWLGVARDHLARRRLRRRRHARPRRRHRAVRRRRTRSCSRSKRDPADDNHARSIDNLRRLELAPRDPASGRCASSSCRSRAPVMMNGERLPASYANFYIANGVVLVPTFNDPQRPRRARHARERDARARESSASTPSIWCGASARCTA